MIASFLNIVKLIILRNLVNHRTFKITNGSGAPDRNRTYDLQIRNLPLYPAELRALAIQ